MDELQAQIADELQRLLPLIEKLTGMTSRWSGAVELIPNAEFKGLKPFSCHIILDADLAQQDIRWSTLIHELLHSCSAGYKRDDFQNLRGWEEGLVEKLQRLWRSHILSSLSISVSEEQFADLDRYHRFNVYIDALEEIRQALVSEGMDDNPETFYKELLAVPLRDRPGRMLQLGYQQTRLPRTPFVRALSAANALLTRRLL
jgi:hypothetical protein